MTVDRYPATAAELRSAPKVWLVTGAAGFIGSHLAERLLCLGQTVVGLDNFATGKEENLTAIKRAVGESAANRFTFITGDIRDLDTCRRACADTDLVLHQAALGSVPRSMSDPLTSHSVNVDGFINMLVAARDARVKRFVYASSSSVYGDSVASPKHEKDTGKVLSPYAATKAINELYGRLWYDAYELETIGLRYFNVFGARQDPEGPYAAVIPRWLATLAAEKPCVIYGDGTTSRDFCFIENVVRANILAATTAQGFGEAFNIACGERTSLNELFSALRAAMESNLNRKLAEVVHEDFRAGDIKHSLAAIDKAATLLGYAPSVKVAEGIEKTVSAFLER
ncbi:MAG: UDP-glucose 4-epimerase [Pseudomonadota bacterium]|jgi:UDP-N-acetylglucosamine 4-epimerase